LGEQFLKKIGDGLMSRGDRSARALAAPNLLSRTKPEIAAADYTITPTAGATLTAGERVHLEAGVYGVRVVRGNRQVATVDNAEVFREAIAARGVASAVVNECSPFGGASIRIREEDSHVP
jgi:hypothetical protein